MINTIQYYEWGSKDALTKLYGIENISGLPMAEMWMGAHPKSSSYIFDTNCKKMSLRKFIARDPNNILGSKVVTRFGGELPFLFKVLSIIKPLSIQVHPNLHSAYNGFIKENKLGIPIDAPNRNYKDTNHKPELVVALTNFQAMSGFRSVSSIVSLLKKVIGVHPTISKFLTNPSESFLFNLFKDLLSMAGNRKRLALNALNNAIKYYEGEPWNTIRSIYKFYPYDNGLFFPLILNIVNLNPGQAMFLIVQPLMLTLKVLL